MSMKRALSYGFILAAALATSACGWQMRGSLATEHLQSIHISGQNSGPFVAQLQKSLRGQGVEFKGADGAQYQIRIDEQKSERRVASVSSSARATEYLLIEKLRFQVLDGMGSPLMPVAELSSERTFEFDEQQVIGKGDESELIRRELRNELIRQLVEQLKHLQPTVNG